MHPGGSSENANIPLSFWSCFGRHTISQTYKSGLVVERELPLPFTRLLLNMLGGGKLLVHGVMCRLEARWYEVGLLSPPALLPVPVLSLLFPWPECVNNGGSTIPAGDWCWIDWVIWASNWIRPSCTASVTNSAIFYPHSVWLICYQDYQRTSAVYMVGALACDLNTYF